MPTRNINNDLQVNSNLYLNMDTNSLSGDSNGAVVLAGYDSLTLKTQSSPRVTINSSGKVGIGTTSPAKTLDITGEIRTSGRATFNEYVNTSLVFGTTDLNLGYAGGTSGIFIKGSTALAGNVGINTTAPQALLHVSHATAPTFRLSRTGTGQIWQQSIDSSGRLLINEAASEGGTQYTRLAIDDGGNVGIGTTNPQHTLNLNL